MRKRREKKKKRRRKQTRRARGGFEGYRVGRADFHHHLEVGSSLKRCTLVGIESEEEEEEEDSNEASRSPQRYFCFLSLCCVVCWCVFCFSLLFLSDLRTFSCTDLNFVGGFSRVDMSTTFFTSFALPTRTTKQNKTKQKEEMKEEKKGHWFASLCFFMKREPSS